MGYRCALRLYAYDMRVYDARIRMRVIPFTVSCVAHESQPSSLATFDAKYPKNGKFARHFG